jgi:16S rRNA (cytosine967-C5)-methyltransferase
VLPRAAQDERESRGPRGGRGSYATGDRRPGPPRRDDDRPRRNDARRRDDRPRRDDARTRDDRPRRDRDDARPRFDRPRRDDARPRRDDARPRRDDSRPRRDDTRPRRDDARPRYDRPRGDRDDARPRFERGARDDRPRRDDARSGYDRPRGDSDRPRRDFDRPRSDRPRTDRPRSDRPRSDRPYGDRPRSDRPRRDFDRPARPSGPRREGDRPRSGGAGSAGGGTGRFQRGASRFTPGGRGRFEREGRPERGDRFGGTATATARPPRTERAPRGERAPRDREREKPAKRGPNVRDLALQVLFQVDVKRAFAERVIEDLTENFKLERRDRALLNELVKGTLRRRGTLDAELERFLHVGLSSLPPWIQNALRLGAYQLVYLDRIPPRAAVDETVKLALKYGHPGTAGLANSVLRRLSEAVGMRDLDLGPVVKDDGTPAWDVLAGTTSHPRWLLERWVARYGIDETIALCEANNRTAALGLRPNRLRLDQKELIKRLEAAGLEATPGKWSGATVWVEADADFANFPAYARGDCTVQDESETLVGLLVQPKPGERVLDLCAAPGGKSTHLAELMGDQGEIVAVEKVAPRARTLTRGIERLGHHSISVHVADGAEDNLLVLGKGGPYDRALVDAPCSGLGVLARRADARWRKESASLPEFAELQGRLLRAAAQVVRPGGVLVYSVCSFEPEETDEVVASFLAGHPEWSKADAAEILPRDVVEEGGSMRLLPHRHGTDGAFAVRLVRATEE